jgi:hypothetical protein
MEELSAGINNSLEIEQINIAKIECYFWQSQGRAGLYKPSDYEVEISTMKVNTIYVNINTFRISW